MTEPAESVSARPVRPQYGEYATPEEVAAARGPLPTAQPDPVPARDARTLPPTGAPIPSRSTGRSPRQSNNLVTALLLVLGIWNTVTSIPSYLDFGPTLTKSLELVGYGSIEFGVIAHTAGVVLLVFSFLVLIAAVGLSLRLIRLGKRSVWVPLVAAVVFFVGSLIVMFVVVANTPALLHVLQNQ